MLCLTNQISGNNFLVSCMVRNNANLSWAGKQVNSHFSEQQSFRFSDILITWTNNHINFGISKTSVCKCANSGNTAHIHNYIGATQIGRVNNNRICTVFIFRRTCGNNIFYTSNFGRCNTHDSGCDVIVAATRNVTANRIHRNEFLPCK